MNVVLKGPEDLPNNIKKEEANSAKDENVLKIQTNKGGNEEGGDDYDLVFEEDYEHDYITDTL